MRIDCGQLFPNSHLHLLVWERFDVRAHTAGMDFVAHCIQQPPFAGKVMPLLRPTGRKETDYAAFDLAFLGGCSGNGLPGLSLAAAGQRLPCCELWLQVSSGLEANLWQEMLRWAGARFASRKWKAWRSHGQALWQPLSKCFSCCDYAETAKATCHCRAAEALSRLCQLSPDETSWFLKLVWYRAAEVVADGIAAGKRVIGLDPTQAADRADFMDVLTAMVDDLTPSRYGIHPLASAVDPTAFVVSHMTAFAAAALLDVQARGHQQYLAMTHPYQFASRSDYLNDVSRNL